MSPDSALQFNSALQFIPPAELRPSPLNPRKHFDADRLAELAKSIEGVGIIEPLVARRVNGHYELVAGERRMRAARLANLETVPVMVKDLTDAQVLEIMVIENNQRDDVSALEEADGFARLLESGYELDKLAERIGRSKKYIYDRVKLLDLVPTAKRLLADGRFSPGHAILIARLKPEQQTSVIAHGLFQAEGQTLNDRDIDFNDREPDVNLDEVTADDDDFRDMKPRTVRELERHIADHVRFDVHHAAAAAPLEYAEVAERVQERLRAPGRGKKVIAITFASYVHPDAKEGAGTERTYTRRAWEFADGQQHPVGFTGKLEVAPRCPLAVLGVVVAGEQYGHAFDVCIARDKCRVHWKQEIAAREKTQKLRDSGQGQKAAQEERQREDRYKAEREKEEADRKAWDALKPKALRELAAHVATLKLTPNLLCQSIDRHYLTTIKELTGAVSDKNLGQVLALAIVLQRGTYHKHVFLESAKAFNFRLKADGAAPAAKPVQTSARASKKKSPSKKAKKKR